MTLVIRAAVCQKNYQKYLNGYEKVQGTVSKFIQLQ